MPATRSSSRSWAGDAAPRRGPVHPVLSEGAKRRERCSSDPLRHDHLHRRVRGPDVDQPEARCREELAVLPAVRSRPGSRTIMLRSMSGAALGLPSSGTTISMRRSRHPSRPREPRATSWFPGLFSSPPTHHRAPQPIETGGTLVTATRSTCAPTVRYQTQSLWPFTRRTNAVSMRLPSACSTRSAVVGGNVASSSPAMGRVGALAISRTVAPTARPAAEPAVSLSAFRVSA